MVLGRSHVLSMTLNCSIIIYSGAKVYGREIRQNTVQTTLNKKPLKWGRRIKMNKSRIETVTNWVLGTILFVIAVIGLLLPTPETATTFAQQHFTRITSIWILIGLGAALWKGFEEAFLVMMFPVLPLWGLIWVINRFKLGYFLFFLFAAAMFFASSLYIAISLHAPIIFIGGTISSVGFIGVAASHLVFRNDWRKAEDAAVPFMYMAAWFAAPVMIIAWSHQTPVSLPSSVEEGMRKGIIM